MDRSWMLKNRSTQEYIDGVNEFVDKAIQHYGVASKIPCPCLMCGNIEHVSHMILKGHLIMYGITKSYKQWIWNGEFGGDDLQEDMEDKDHEGDRLEDMIHDVHEDLLQSGVGIDELLSDAKEPLYNGCSKFSKLSSVVKLYNLKAANGWSDTSFTTLLELLKDMLPNGNSLLSRVYEARKTLSHMGLNYVKIHACPNDCVLYRNEYENHQSCPSCNAPRYKKKNVPAKVLWYFPIIPRLKRMFTIPDEEKNLIWHEKERLKDGKLRHPAYSPQWRFIDKKYPDFGRDSRNIRFALSADGVCTHDSLKSSYRPKQLGNDIDVYLAPLIEDLKQLWEVGVEAFDAHSDLKRSVKPLKWILIKCPPQTNNTDCGYYVLRYMLDIMRSKRNITLQGFGEILGSNSLLNEKIDEVRDQWVAFVQKFM